MKQNCLPSTLRSFVWYYLRYKKLYVVGFIMVALVWAVEMSLTPYLLKMIIDNIAQYSTIRDDLFHALYLPVVFYCLMSFIVNINFRFYEYLSQRLYPDLKGAIQKDLLVYVLQHSNNFFQNSFSGSITKRITDLAENIEQLIKIPHDLFCPRVLAVLVASIMLSEVVHPIFAIGLVLWMILFTSFSFIASKKIGAFSKKKAEAINETTGVIADILLNIMTIRIFNSIPYEMTYIDNYIKRTKVADKKLRLFNLKVNFLSLLSTTVFIAFVFIELIYRLQKGLINSGDVILVTGLSITFMQSMYAVGSQMQQFYLTIGVCTQSLMLLKRPHEIIDIPHAQALEVSNGEIAFEKVSFSYVDTKPLFKDLSIIIRPGEKVGIVGLSGSGKSTFIKLLLRIHDIQSGEILIDGQSIKKVTQYSLRQQIAMIQQESELLNRSFIENIKYGKTEAQDNEIVRAAKQSRCHEFIMKCPEQYQTIIGERGIKLSGGEKQRIAIARAFLKDAPILLMDEATSSLDSITESYIQMALTQIMKNKTVLIIAHRLSSLNNMDRIIVFFEGKIVQDGTLDSLLADKHGQFNRLWRMQSTEFLGSLEGISNELV